MQLSLFTYQEEEGTYFYIWDTGWAFGSGHFKAFPTLLANIFKGIDTRTNQVQYYRELVNKDYPTYRRLQHYWSN